MFTIFQMVSFFLEKFLIPYVNLNPTKATVNFGKVRFEKKQKPWFRFDLQNTLKAQTVKIAIWFLYYNIYTLQARTHTHTEFGDCLADDLVKNGFPASPLGY